MFVHNILHMHRLIEGYTLRSLHSETSTLSHWEQVSSINKTKRSNLFVSKCPSGIAADTNTTKCLCMFMPYLWVCMCLYVYLKVRVSSLHHLKVLWYSCMFIRVHSASKSASSRVFFKWWHVLGELAEAFRVLWHWWCGRRCGTQASVGSGCSSKPGTGWRSPPRPAAAHTSRTAQEPGWAGNSPF